MIEDQVMISYATADVSIRLLSGLVQGLVRLAWEPIVTGEYYRLETAAIRTQENVTTA